MREKELRSPRLPLLPSLRFWRDDCGECVVLRSRALRMICEACWSSSVEFLLGNAGVLLRRLLVGVVGREPEPAEGLGEEGRPGGVRHVLGATGAVVGGVGGTGDRLLAAADARLPTPCERPKSMQTEARTPIRPPRGVYYVALSRMFWNTCDSRVASPSSCSRSPGKST